MLTSEAAIKAIIESVIKKSQSNHELEQITTGPDENLSQPLNSDHNLTGREHTDLEQDIPTEYNSSLGGNNAEKSGRTASPTAEKIANMGNLEEGGKGQICKVEKNTRTQVDTSIFIFMLI